jgi:hypothetical protein
LTLFVQAAVGAVRRGAEPLASGSDSEDARLRELESLQCACAGREAQLLLLPLSQLPLQVLFILLLPLTTAAEEKGEPDTLFLFSSSSFNNILICRLSE